MRLTFLERALKNLLDEDGENRGLARPTLQNLGSKVLISLHEITHSRREHLYQGTLKFKI